VKEKHDEFLDLKNKVLEKEIEKMKRDLLKKEEEEENERKKEMEKLKKIKQTEDLMKAEREM